jgi:hypothetical protein
MIPHDWLLLGMAVVLLVTNCLGAAFTIRRLPRRGQEPKFVEGPNLKTALDWASFQNISMVLSISATAVSVLLLIRAIKFSDMHYSVLGLVALRMLGF